MEFEKWVEQLPKQLTNDPLWKSKYYQLACYLFDLVWNDYDILKNDYRTRVIVNQLIRSAGSICANMEEAYGRGVKSKDHTRILRIALGETREAKGWYLRSRKVLPKNIINHRLELLEQIISILTRIIRNRTK